MSRTNTLSTLLDSFLEAAAEYVENSPTLILLCLFIFYAGTTAALATNRPFWYDELHTYHLIRLPTMADTLQTVREGGDLQPPLLYLTTRVSAALFGPTELGVRIPQILGFFLMQLAIFATVAKRSAKSIALAAAVFPMLTGAHNYAYEARPYGLLMGFCGLSVMFYYGAAASKRSNRTACLGLAFSLSVAVLSHTLSLAVLGLFFLAEFSRLVVNRRFDWRILLSMSVAPLSLAALLYPPLVEAQRRGTSNSPLLAPELYKIRDFYHFLFDPASIFLILLLALLLFCRQTNQFTVPILNESKPEISHLHESVMAWLLVLLPLPLVIATSFATGIFLPRYALCAVVGAALLFAQWLSKSLPSAKSHHMAITFVMLACYLSPFLPVPSLGTAKSFEDPDFKIEQVEPGLPFVVANGLEFMKLDFYTDRQFARRLRYLYDLDIADRYTGGNVLDLAHKNLSRHYQIHGTIAPYTEFVKEGKPFLLYVNAHAPMQWLPQKLLDDKWKLRLLHNRSDASLYLATR